MANRESAENRLAQFFKRNGYIRKPNQKRKKELEQNKYKKGYEVRLVASSEDELAEIRDLVIQVGFKPARPYKKNKQIVQPIYGKPAMEYFQKFKKKHKKISKRPEK